MSSSSLEQDQPTDSGLLSLLLIAGLHGVSADIAKLQHEFGADAFTGETILRAAQFLGMRAKVVKQDAARLNRVPLPAIAQDKHGHFFVVAKVDTGQPAATEQQPANLAGLPDSTRILIQRPGQAPNVMRLDEFLALWSGQMLFLVVPPIN